MVTDHRLPFWVIASLISLSPGPRVTLRVVHVVICLLTSSTTDDRPDQMSKVDLSKSEPQEEIHLYWMAFLFIEHSILSSRVLDAWKICPQGTKAFMNFW